MSDKNKKETGINRRAAQSSELKNKENAKNAQSEAEKDLAADAGFTAHNENDDLDEGETARLGEDKTDLV